jgi:hypothetical protein
MPLFDDMLEWVGRWQQRQRELASRVDADLVRANRKKYRFSWTLFALAFVLLGFQAVFKLRGVFHEVAIWITSVCFVGGMILIRWAKIQRSFLERPTPKEPAKFWTWR